MARDRMPERAMVLGARLLVGLRKALAGHPHVLAIRGLGLMVGIELECGLQGTSWARAG